MASIIQLLRRGPRATWGSYRPVCWTWIALKVFRNCFRASREIAKAHFNQGNGMLKKVKHMEECCHCRVCNILCFQFIYRCFFYSLLRWYMTCCLVMMSLPCSQPFPSPSPDLLSPVLPSPAFASFLAFPLLFPVTFPPSFYFVFCIFFFLFFLYLFLFLFFFFSSFCLLLILSSSSIFFFFSELNKLWLLCDLQACHR